MVNDVFKEVDGKGENILRYSVLQIRISCCVATLPSLRVHVPFSVAERCWRGGVRDAEAEAAEQDGFDLERQGQGEGREMWDLCERDETWDVLDEMCGMWNTGMVQMWLRFFLCGVCGS